MNNKITQTLLLSALFIIISFPLSASEKLPGDAFSNKPPSIAAKNFGANKKFAEDALKQYQKTSIEQLGRLVAELASGNNGHSKWLQIANVSLKQLGNAEKAYNKAYSSGNFGSQSMKDWFKSERTAWNNFHKQGVKLKLENDKILAAFRAVEQERGTLPSRKKAMKNIISNTDKIVAGAIDIITNSKAASLINATLGKITNSSGLFSLVTNLHKADLDAIKKFQKDLDIVGYRERIKSFIGFRLDPNASGVFSKYEKKIDTQLSKTLALYVKSANDYLTMAEPWTNNEFLDGTKLKEAGYSIENVDKADDKMRINLIELLKEHDKEHAKVLKDLNEAKTFYDKANTNYKKIRERAASIFTELKSTENSLVIWKAALSNASKDLSKQKEAKKQIAKLEKQEGQLTGKNIELLEKELAAKRAAGNAETTYKNAKDAYVQKYPNA